MRLFTVSQRSSYAPMTGWPGVYFISGNVAYSPDAVAVKDIWVRPPTRARAEVAISSVELTAKPGGTH
nr:hypothetical protein [Mycobacterium uberis]